MMLGEFRSLPSVLLLSVAACFVGCGPVASSGARPVAAPLQQAGPIPEEVAAEKVPLFAGVMKSYRDYAKRRAALPWLKGSTHVHTLYSGDSRTPPSEVVKWYAEHGYDFIVITDHNRVTDDVSADLSGGKMVVLRGTELTNNPPVCEPAPLEPKGRCRIHVNALFVSQHPANRPMERPEKIEWRERKSIKRVDLYQAALGKTAELGGLAQLNHPSWHWGVDSALAIELAARGLRFIEIANVAFSKWNGGGGTHVGTEALWDAMLTAGHRVWGVASDDAHHYRDRDIEAVVKRGRALYPPGGGFSMIRADRNPASIRAAMDAGDFYASTGLLFKRHEVRGNQLVVEIDDPRANAKIELIGSGGRLLESADGSTARFDLSGRGSNYVRVRAQAPGGASAWAQPIFLPTGGRK